MLAVVKCANCNKEHYKDEPGSWIALEWKPDYCKECGKMKGAVRASFCSKECLLEFIKKGNLENEINEG